MKALVTTGEKTAKVSEVPVPEPRGGEILIKVHYVDAIPLLINGATGRGLGDGVGAPANVRVESTIAYTVFWNPPGLRTYAAFDNSGGDGSEDRKFWEKYLKALPKWLQDGHLKPNPQVELGGLGASRLALNGRGRVA
ncbi:hypothetical protein EsDP_00006507 [Epichloe bromicola]|uniref:Uncharacterized protein n=1 Tax=Epichloe bromicola TaxID=79588 RepID=A0ABQ0CXT8_9HYPO